MKFIAIMISIPFIVLFLYMAIYPRESSLWGKKWQFKNENLEPSDEVVKYNRFMAVIALIGIIILLVVALTKG
ncbi:hypothetical protein [Clostridium sp. 'White wine YQ']|uniref:hypothetical protein n=1 Tax=Clostridium sp. 'White wine YQ' TaxID=3027474 RepID=UPI0023660637|nr:hypothetical protein [Clostridium sp. 'White wine YQ']MDD7794474.1 hypothetical protein [Clostridium sp. 'White wine YQ']